MYTGTQSRLIDKDRKEQGGGGGVTHLRDISLKTDNSKAASMSPQLQPLIADGMDVRTDICYLHFKNSSTASVVVVFCIRRSL